MNAYIANILRSVNADMVGTATKTGPVNLVVVVVLAWTTERFHQKHCSQHGSHMHGICSCPAHIQLTPWMTEWDYGELAFIDL